MQAETEIRSFPRRILLAVTGLSPQIVTETLYALAVDGRPAWIPTEVLLITTAEGADRARLSLLTPGSGRFHQLCSDYGLPPIQFTEADICVVSHADGMPLRDIQTPDDNARVADAITDRVRELTADPDTQLHVSIAGGRKTMGFYLGYALSLYGRPQDELSHVLVSEHYESHPDFFYPTPTTQVIHTRDKKPLDTRLAKVVLARIPFVSLRHNLENLLNGQATFIETVAAARQALAPPELTIDIRAQRIRAAGKAFHVPKAELALLCLFARRAQRGQPAIAAPNKEVADIEWATAYLSELRRIAGDMADIESTERALQKGMDGNYFSPRLAKLRKILRRQLGPAAGPYHIDGPPRYKLAIPPHAIRFGQIETDSPTKENPE